LQQALPGGLEEVFDNVTE